MSTIDSEPIEFLFIIIQTIMFENHSNNNLFE